MRVDPKLTSTSRYYATPRSIRGYQRALDLTRRGQESQGDSEAQKQRVGTGDSSTRRRGMNISRYLILHTVHAFHRPPPLSSALSARSGPSMTTMSSAAVRIVLSPAKTVDLTPLPERDLSVDSESVRRLASSLCGVGSRPPCDAGRTSSIVREMKGKSQEQLKSLLKLSPKLAGTAAAHWNSFDGEEASSGDDRIPAIYMFSGPAFQGLDPQTCDEGTLEYLARNLVVLDPVFGTVPALKPIQPYRLEMGTKIPAISDETLASHWREPVTSWLADELRGTARGDAKNNEDGDVQTMILCNLASDEYSSSIDPSSLPSGTIYLTCKFRTGGKSPAVHSKRARGLMSRHMAEVGASSLECICRFDLENYRCVGPAEGVEVGVVGVVGENVRLVEMSFERSAAPPKEKAAVKKRPAGGTNKEKKGDKKTKR